MIPGWAPGEHDTSKREAGYVLMETRLGFRDGDKIVARCVDLGIDLKGFDSHESAQEAVEREVEKRLEATLLEIRKEARPMKECPVCDALPGEPHKMSCRPQNREDAARKEQYTMSQQTPKNILLVYEEIPERTVIALLDRADLAAAGLSASEVASIHGNYRNNSETTEAQDEIHDKVWVCIFGEYDEAAEDHKPALWKDKIIFATDDESLCREGMPPSISGDTVIVHTGFAL